ncbi:HAD-IIIA family hydrolase [candidate division KSB1 bacterium]|nr:HAD-IIIA family hydrolase [candidate division KSB1 bacterium]
MKKALFFDKDGILTIDHGIEYNYDRIDLMPDIDGVVVHARRCGYLIVVVTNQPAVARGRITIADLEIHLDRFRAKLTKQNPSALVDAIYYCPHHPNADLSAYRILCDCRKPKPGMLLRAAAELDIDLSHSTMIGDRLSDIIAGKLAGCTTIHCLTGRHEEQMIQTDLQLDREIAPDYTLASVAQVKGVIE